jgi:origin recognition complex subunit 5
MFQVSAAPSSSSSSSSLTNNLSVTSKYLLIAAFLASYNPSDKDQQIFDAGRGKKRRKKTSQARKNGGAHFQQIVLGPKWFTYDRMFAIMQAISDGKGASQSFGNLSKRAQALIAMSLITKAEVKNGLLGECKLCCNVSYSRMVEIATTIGFAMGQWLYNPE